MNDRVPWFVFGVILCFGSPVEGREVDSPHILILYADDLGFGDVGAFHSGSKIPTVNLDRLASSGMCFTDAHSSSGICTPSRYALLTGRHHWRDFHGIVGVFGKSVFAPERLTLPEMVRDSGYATACVGKWHLGWNWDAIKKPDAKPREGMKGLPPEAFDWSQPIPDGPLAHGFDSYFGDTVINFPPYAWIRDDRVVEAPTVMMNSKQWKKIKEGGWECRPGPMVEGWDPYQVLPHVTDKAVDEIRAWKQRDRPSFLYVAFPSPHAPIIPNDAFDETSSAGPYGDFVVETDHACGRILDALDEYGLSENTLVIFSADNGPEAYAYARDRKYDHWSAEPFRGLKRDLYEGGHHVPMIIRWPGVTEADQECSALVSQVDIMGTLSAALQYDLPDNAAEDSHDLLPLLRQEKPSVRETLVHNTKKGRYALRHQQWLLVDGQNGYHSRKDETWENKRDYPKDDDGASELYDLSQDPGQRENLSAQKPEKVGELLTKLNDIRQGKSTAPRLRSQ